MSSRWVNIAQFLTGVSKEQPSPATQIDPNPFAYATSHANINYLQEQFKNDSNVFRNIRFSEDYDTYSMDKIITISCRDGDKYYTAQHRLDSRMLDCYKDTGDFIDLIKYNLYQQLMRTIYEKNFKGSKIPSQY